MKKSILIFGAGINQLTLIEAANELGITSVAIDPNPKAPGKKLADHFYSHLGNDENFPGSMEYFGGLLRIPIYPSLTINERELVVKAVKKVLGI